MSDTGCQRSGVFPSYGVAVIIVSFCQGGDKHPVALRRRPPLLRTTHSIPDQEEITARFRRNYLSLSQAEWKFLGFCVKCERKKPQYSFTSSIFR